MSEAEEIAIRTFAKNVGIQWGDFVSTALSEFLILVVVLRKPGIVTQIPRKVEPVPIVKVSPPLKQSKDRLLKAGDVADRLNISKTKAYQLLQRGEIPCIRMNRTTRVRPEDLETYILQNIH